MAPNQAAVVIMLNDERAQGEIVLEIQDLTNCVQELSENVDFWNSAMRIQKVNTKPFRNCL
jgi:hypothetical protein